jgi:hypothetical protein
MTVVPKVFQDPGGSFFLFCPSGCGRLWTRRRRASSSWSTRCSARRNASRRAAGDPIDALAFALDPATYAS